MDSGAFNSEPAQVGALGAALEREHREIDAGIDAFRGSASDGGTRPADDAIRAAARGTQPGDGATHAEQDRAVMLLRRAMDALRRHIYLEEEFLFPAMRAQFAIPIGVMLREHGEIWQTLDAMQAKLAESDSRSDLLSACEELAGQLDRHNGKEEPIFYTQADRSLDAVQAKELDDFLRSGQMPPGWICQVARP